MSAFFATRAPYQDRQFAHGVALLREGAAQEAIKCFNRALKSDPQFVNARFERGKAFLEVGDSEQALEDFAAFEKIDDDVRADTYIGYCFNLQQDHSAAIAWYERALEQGTHTLGLLNNLGVSYVFGRSRFGHIERFDVAQKCLDDALAINPRSTDVHRNIVMISLMRAGLDPKFNLKAMLPHLEYLQRAEPQSNLTQQQTIQFYSRLSLTDDGYIAPCFDAIESALKSGTGPDSDTLRTSDLFTPIRTDARFSDLLALSDGSRKREPLGKRKIFLDPVESPSSPLQNPSE